MTNWQMMNWLTPSRVKAKASWNAVSPRLSWTAAAALQISVGLGLGALLPQRVQQPSQAAFSVLPARLGIAAPAAAASKGRIRWTPPKEQGNAKGTLSGGRRGQESSSCLSNGRTVDVVTAGEAAGATARDAAGADKTDVEATRLNLLVPAGRSSLVTTSNYPTFSWQLETAQATTLEFILSDISQPTPIYQQTLQASASQLMSLTLPKDHPLQADKSYRWTVIVRCPEGHKAEIYARSFIRKISGESLEQQLNPDSAVAQAAVFAEHGIWYDALGRLLQAPPTAPDNPQAALSELLLQALPKDR